MKVFETCGAIRCAIDALRAVARSLAEYESESDSRNSASRIAYASGAYSYQSIGNYFGLHFTRAGVIVRPG
jgi:hypothetical protein